MNLADVLRGTESDVYRTTPIGLSKGITAPADFGAEFTGTTIDSRQAAAGSLFIALPGEHTDGHDFVASAFASQALGAVVKPDFVQDRAGNLPPNRFLFVADDPLKALQSLAHYWRKIHDAEIVCVTGSVGKTSVKEAVAHLLEPLGYGSVLKSRGNYNSEIGLPLELLNLKASHKVAVLEVGMYQVGDVGFLARLAKPSIGVVTNVQSNHLERTGSIERTAQGKAQLVHGLPRDGLAVLNGMDVFTRAMSTATPARSITYGCTSAGTTAGATPSFVFDFVADKVTGHGHQGFSVCIRHGSHRLEVSCPTPGKHNALNLLPGVAIAHRLGLTWDEIGEAIQSFVLTGRAQFSAGPQGSLVLDDSYNASPSSVVAALELLLEEPGRHVAVLGDMLELGTDEEPGHRLAGQAAAALDLLVAVGPRARWIANEARRAGLHSTRIHEVDDNQTAMSLALEAAEPQTTILVKGSRLMHLEEIAEGLRTAAG
jgi:UDP-N-acetylmuramoyl-tripeptide--D-alanyl-D-alanine ligase